MISTNIRKKINLSSTVPLNSHLGPTKVYDDQTHGSKKNVVKCHALLYIEEEISY